MAKLPGEEDLGRLPAMTGDRAIGVSDASGVAVGAAAIGQGATNLGKGISELGQALGDVSKVESSFEYSRAHSDYLTKETDLRTQLSNDQDYTTLTKRYQDQTTKLRNDSAALITSPPERERFLQNTNLTIAQGSEGMTGRATKMAADANGAWVSQTNNKLIDQGTATDDPIERAKYIDAGIANIDGRLSRGEIGPTEALAAKQAFVHQYALADGIVRSDRDPQGVLNELRAAPGSGDAVTNRILQVEGSTKNSKSSAVGDGQFIDGTWLDMIKRNRPDLADGRTDPEILALRNDKELARSMTDKYRQDNTAYLQKQGIQPTAGNVYLAHFLGPGGAAAVLKADPTMPAIDALTDAVGEKKAQAMVDANPTILNSLSGNVVKWADGKMGGAGAHDTVYNFLPPAMRAQLAQHAQEQLDKQTATDTSDFTTKVQDTLAEAGRNGSAQAPVSQGEFVRVLGAKKGLDAYSDYQLDMKLRSDVSQVARLTPQQQNDLVKSYDPKPGDEGFADQNKRQVQLQAAVAKVHKERDDDPAQFAISRIPSVQDAFAAFSKVQADPTAAADVKQAAARDFINKTVLEQQKAGVSADNVKILPDAMVSKFNDAVTKAADSDDPNARTGLIKLVQDQAALYGDNWPLVYRQMAPEAIPTVRAIAAGADPTAMTRLLNLGPKENPAALLKEQNETKAKDVRTALNTAMAPLLSSMVGRQKDRDYADYYNMAEKLAALYVRDGKEAGPAATDAFNALIGNRYDFRDSYRIPKSPSYSADDVQAGALVAKSMIGTLPTVANPGLPQATADMNLTPQEQALYQRHLTNLSGPGGVDNPPDEQNPKGSRSTLFQATVEHDGKFYTIPTVYDGKILWDKNAPDKAAAAVAKAAQIGWDKFPAYATENEAEARYQKMHEYMERDTGQFMDARAGNPLFNVRPAVDDVGGLTDARGDSLAKFKRDGVWVTSPRNDGLNLMYGDKAVRGTDGAPLFVPWAQLAKMGASTEVRAAGMRRDFWDQTP